MSSEMRTTITNFDDLYLPEHYLIVRINPDSPYEKYTSWWTYDTRLGCEIDRIHGRFAKRLLKTGYIEFVQEQEHLRRTVFRKTKTPKEEGHE